MQLIIAGAHRFTDYQRLCQVLAPDRHRITQVLTGGARGAERLGYRWTWKHAVRHQRFQADWERFDKTAWRAAQSPAGPGRRRPPRLRG
jgi:hypothetical protein